MTEKTYTCPFCENDSDSPITPISLTVGPIKTDAWICKSCKGKALDSIQFAGQVVQRVLDETLRSPRIQSDEDDLF